MHSSLQLGPGAHRTLLQHHLPAPTPPWSTHSNICSSSRSSSRSRSRLTRCSRHISSQSSSNSSTGSKSWPHCPLPQHSNKTAGLHGPAAAVLRPLSAAAAAEAVTAADPARAARLSAPVVVIGGGPAGLCTALMLARRGYTQIKVFERLPEPPAPDDLSVWGDFEQASERLYMIGLNGRGQAVLRDLDVMDRIDTASSLVLGRLDWQPDTPPDSPRMTRYTTRTYKTRCIQRDRLASCLLQEIRQKYSDVVSVQFDARCVRAEWMQSGPGGAEVCKLTFQQQQQQPSSSSSSSTSGSTGTTSATANSSSSSSSSSSTSAAVGPVEWTEESSFVVGADGAGSSLRSAMERSSSTPFSVKRFEDKNTIVYRTIPLFWPKEMADSRPGDLNYSIRTKSGINLDCLPTKEGPFIGVMLYKPGDERIAALKTAEDVRALFQEQFPAFLPAVREIDLERFAAKSECSLPTFSYAGPVLHYGSSAALVGDAIHTVKPYFGQGVNSAFEDVKVLQQALEETEDDAGAAVQRYTQLRAKDAEALVVLSHSLDGGFFTFIGPLILDSMLNRLLPKVFSPNIIASLQNEKWSFAQIRARKRWDRAMQVGLLGGLMLVLVRVVTALLGLAGKLLSRAGAV